MPLISDRSFNVREKKPERRGACHIPAFPQEKGLRGSDVEGVGAPTSDPRHGNRSQHLTRPTAESSIEARSFGEKGNRAGRERKSRIDGRQGQAATAKLEAFQGSLRHRERGVSAFPDGNQRSSRAARPKSPRAASSSEPSRETTDIYGDDQSRGQTLRGGVVGNGQDREQSCGDEAAAHAVAESQELKARYSGWKSLTSPCFRILVGGRNRRRR